MAGEVDAVHVYLNIDHQRGHEASEWYQLALGAVPIYDDWSRTGLNENHVYVTRACLWLGPPGRHVILEIQEGLREAAEKNHSNQMVFLYSAHPVDMRNRVLAAQGVLQGEIRRGEHVIFKVRDPYGFSWMIGSMNTIPDEDQEKQEVAMAHKEILAKVKVCIELGRLIIGSASRSVLLIQKLLERWPMDGLLADESIIIRIGSSC